MQSDNNLPEDLFTPADVQRVRKILLERQEGKCAITGTPVVKPCLDHRHDEDQFVRGVLSHSINTFLGHVEGAYKRRVAWCLDIPLPELLRACAGYLEASEGFSEYRHVGWRKKLQTLFNKLTASEQNKVLKELIAQEGKNPAERKKFFKSLTADRELGYITISETIKRVQDDND